MAENKSLTAKTLGSMPVAERIHTYQDLLLQRDTVAVTSKKNVEKLQRFLSNLAMNYNPRIEKRNFLIREKRDERIHDKNFTDFVYNTGQYVRYLVAPGVIDELTKFAGKTVVAKLEELGNLYSSWVNPKVDYKETEKQWKEYQVLSKQVLEDEVSLQEIQLKLSSEQELVDHVSKLASIARYAKEDQ